MVCPRLILPGVTQEAAASPPRAKDPLTGLIEGYRDVLPLPLAGVFSGQEGCPETIEGDEDPNAANNKEGSQ